LFEPSDYIDNCAIELDFIAVDPVIGLHLSSEDVEVEVGPGEGDRIDVKGDIVNLAIGGC
jgi:hypothetical protein